MSKFLSFRLQSSAAVALALALISTQTHSQSDDANIFNSPTFRGNVKVLSVEAAFTGGLLGAKADAGGGRVEVGSITRAKGAKTGQLTNAPLLEGNQSLFATGDITAQSIRVDEGAKTGSIQNSTSRKGDIEVYAGGMSGSLSILNRSLETRGSVVVDGVHVCAGAKAGDITNTGSTTGKTTAIGGRVSINSVVVGC